MSRNLAVAHARGSLTAFVDADDLVSQQWFTRAVAEAQVCRGVLHPECNVNFGTHSAIFLHRASTTYDLRALLVHNLWSALSLGPTEIYRNNPYAQNDVHRGFGYEDWHWNCETLSLGIPHYAVPGTCHFIRLRTKSLSQDSRKNRCVIRRTRLWSALLANRPGDPHHPTCVGPADGSLGAELLDKDPWELPTTTLPAWLQAEIESTRTIDPSFCLADVLLNFSPFRNNQYLPAFPECLLDHLARGARVLRLGGSILAASDDLILTEDESTSNERHLSLPRLRKNLGEKLDHFLAMLVVQCGIEEVHIHPPGHGVDFLHSHSLPLRHTLRRIIIHTTAGESPPPKLQVIYGELLHTAQ